MNSTKRYQIKKTIFHILYRPPFKSLIDFIFKLLLIPLSKIFKIVAFTGIGSNHCLKNEFLPIRVHYYSPVPNIEELEKRKVWDICSNMVGVDFKINEQIQQLKRLGKLYAEECKWPLLQKDAAQNEFYLKNTSFSYGCAASTHCMIRNSKPENFIEIGSGMSSLVISRALQLNKLNDGSPCDYTIVDPYPGNDVTNGNLAIDEVVENRVELLDPDFFSRLQENDILFIDSGHCVRIGGDVNFLYLEVLPRLHPGVIIHIHDIALPYEYSKTYLVSESFRQLWTEQYLLQSFLSFNNQFEILLAMNYLMFDHLKLFKNTFPYYDSENHPFLSGSFWIRRKMKN
jgi:hypothetical protein